MVKKSVIQKMALSIAALCIVFMQLAMPVHADTDGTEIKIAQQPDRLIFQLGPKWAGVEFELKTDAGLFPVPIAADASGVLKMDLGGSKTYTLSCLNSSVAIPDPQKSSAPDLSSSLETTESDPAQPSVNQDQSGIPPLHLILFIGGLILGIGVLAVLWIIKRSRVSYYDDDDDYDEE